MSDFLVSLRLAWRVVVRNWVIEVITQPVGRVPFSTDWWDTRHPVRRDRLTRLVLRPQH
jgi:hypothetical protein